MYYYSCSYCIFKGSLYNFTFNFEYSTGTVAYSDEYPMQSFTDIFSTIGLYPLLINGYSEKGCLNKIYFIHICINELKY